MFNSAFFLMASAQTTTGGCIGDLKVGLRRKVSLPIATAAADSVGAEHRTADEEPGAEPPLAARAVVTIVAV